MKIEVNMKGEEKVDDKSEEKRVDKNKDKNKDRKEIEVHEYCQMVRGEDVT